MTIDMYKGTKNSSWSTPDDIFEALNKSFILEFDLACSADNIKCPEGFVFPDNDALRADWPTDKLCWMNPPFSRASSFFNKCKHECYLRGVKLISIYKASNLETKQWQKEIFCFADYVLFLNKRTAFVPPPGVKATGPAFGCALIFANVFLSDYVKDSLSEIGRLIEV